MDANDQTFDELRKLKVSELREHLTKLGLHVSGLKADLVARLSSYYESQESKGSEIVKIEEDVLQGTSLLEAGDASLRNLAPVEALRAQSPVECEIIEQDDTQKEPLMIPNVPQEITEVIRSKDSAVSEPGLDGRQIDTIVTSDSPREGMEERIPDKEPISEEPMQDDSRPVEQEVILQEVKSSSPNDVSQPEHEVQSEQSRIVVPTEQDSMAPRVVQIVDDMIVDIVKIEDNVAIDTSSGARSLEEPEVEYVEDDEREVDLHGASMADVQASEPEHVQANEPEVLPGSEPKVLQASKSEVLQEILQARGPEVLQARGPEVLQARGPEVLQARGPDVLQAREPEVRPGSEPEVLQASEPEGVQASKTGDVQTEIPASDNVLPQDSQMPSRDTAVTEASHPRHTEANKSSARRERTVHINTAPVRAPRVVPERTIPAGRVHMVNDLSKGSSKDSRVGVRNLNHISKPGARGDDSGYDVDQGEQEDHVAAKAAQQVQEPGKKKKKKKKRRKKKGIEQEKVQDYDSPDDEGIEVEYIPETLELDAKDPIYAQFAQIFETFKLTEKTEDSKKDDAKEKKDDQTAETQKKDANDETMDTDSDEDETENQDEQTGEKVEKLSKKKLKLKNRMSVAELKQHVHRPDVVEMHDVTAPDPKLLVYLKACRNTVPVPRHWCFKRKFLQGKRGIIKPPFQLPEFIQKTGIMEMREALQEKEDAKNMKAKMREKVRPKMGKIDIDYQKLHDAFFKWQTKPKMSIHGDLYYEGKEFETKLKQKKPGDLSEELRTALGMPTGQGSNLVPPPWLIAMQRYGPPPSYPNLKIPGLNAPIPEGASFGYHAGGWGKPPVDEHGRPLYGDVFGMQQADMNLIDDDQVDSALWGELESESEESEESEEESEEEPADQSGLITPAETGLVTPSGLTSIPAGMETPDMIELRKRKNIEEAMEGGGEQPTLYTVLPEKRVGVGAAMMGSAHVYDLATAGAPTGTKKTPGGLSEGVEVALDPSELELDPAAMQARYDEQLREQQSVQKEDFSDMVAEHAAKQQKKRKKTTDSGKGAKKYKEFKF